MANVMGRIYANRNTAGPQYQFDTRVVNGLVSPSAVRQAKGLGPGIIPFPGLGTTESASVGKTALTILSVGVLAVVGFNVWTRAYQS